MQMPLFSAAAKNKVEYLDAPVPLVKKNLKLKTFDFSSEKQKVIKNVTQNTVCSNS